MWQTSASTGPGFDASNVSNRDLKKHKAFPLLSLPQAARLQPDVVSFGAALSALPV